jgi:putative GTP pyrophosphokinase
MLDRPAPDTRLDGLRQWIESGSIEMALKPMAKKNELPHWGSKGAVNRAGEALRNDSLGPGQADVLESWRMAHRDVINTFQALLRARKKAKNLNVEVAQRLKRRATIVDKLSRLPGMQLARMDDVAGCRLIFSDVKTLHEFRSSLHKAKFKHILKNEKNKYDYIESPTDRGYRGIHDIYEHRSKKGNTKCDGLLIEIQYRTDVQHAWATAVEVVTELTEHEPKFDRGDRRYIKLFCLASEMLARTQEGMPPRLFPELSNKELYAEFEAVNGEIHAMQMLLDLMFNEWLADRVEADHIILRTSKKDGFKLYQFDLELEASAKLLELEKEFPEDNIVLVGAQTVEEVKSAFRNYFNDVRDFLNLMVKAYEALDPETHAARMKKFESDNNE